MEHELGIAADPFNGSVLDGWTHGWVAVHRNSFVPLNTVEWPSPTHLELATKLAKSASRLDSIYGIEELRRLVDATLGDGS